MEVRNKMKFTELQLAEPVLRAVELEKYITPSPIQEQAIPHLLLGKDLLGCAQTGTGKTAAFALPIINDLYLSRDTSKRRTAKALVLAPTRELAAQVGASFAAFGKFAHIKTAVIFGGVSQRPQEVALRNGVDVIVATPGRLVDLLRQRVCDLRSIEKLVLDEADHMLDLGFIHDVKSIIAKIPNERQTLLFSATMPKEIETLARSVLRDPVRVAVNPVSSPVETVAQSVYHVDKPNKSKLLIQLLEKGGIAASLVFSRTKHGADKLCKILNNAGIKSDAIHGNKSQAARKDALSSFKKGKLRVLVATDIAARGIDIQSLNHVVNYDLPDVPETYVHRIGRTGRAGRSGEAVSFCDSSERSSLKAIERLISHRIPSVIDHSFAGKHVEHAPAEKPVPNRRGSGKKEGVFMPKPQKRNQKNRSRDSASAGNGYPLQRKWRGNSEGGKRQNGVKSLHKSA
jgi:Superfamily II DNA and RNA helicases